MSDYDPAPPLARCHPEPVEGWLTVPRPTRRAVSRIAGAAGGDEAKRAPCLRHDLQTTDARAKIAPENPCRSRECTWDRPGCCTSLRPSTRPSADRRIP